MYYVEKVRTWKDNWNNVIRRVLFKDKKLKEQMLIPEDTPIDVFVNKYFIEDVNIGEILSNEKVRISYHDSESSDTRNKNVRRRFKEFDIYVKNDVDHTASNDFLRHRYHLIAERLKYLLLKDRHICGLTFSFEDEYDLWTKTIGYNRYHVVFSYFTTV